ncbi:NADH-ubiquinone oxidoreductase [Kalaharituber pfeilii]|nr:NADH-ubiquinone oxidoreductase [Kalaharituber pfeilii]
MALRLNAVSRLAARALGTGASSGAPSGSIRLCAAQGLRAFSTARPMRQLTEDDLPNPRTFERPKLGPIQAPIQNPADAYVPVNESLHSYGRYLLSCLPKHLHQFSVWKDELTIYIPPTSVVPVFTFLKLHTAAQFTQVSDIAGVDYPTRPYRFEVVYNLLSIKHNSRIRVKTYANETTPVPSITCLYDGANWFEREAHDLYGIFFINHPDLRRIMTDYGFDGHPLRKDFPLTGYTEVRYDEEKKRIVSEPLELTQQFRNFQGGSSVWEQVGAGRDVTPDSSTLPTPKPEPKPDEKK